MNEVSSRKEPVPGLRGDGEKIHPGDECLDDPIAVRLDQGLARCRRDRQARDQPATAAHLGRQLAVAHAARHREGVQALLVIPARGPGFFREQAGIDGRQVGCPRRRPGDDREVFPVLAAMDAALVIQASLGHGRVRDDPRTEVILPRRQARRQRDAEPARRRECPARRAGDQLGAGERRQHLRRSAEQIAGGQQHLDLKIAGVGAAAVLDGEADRDRVARRRHARPGPERAARHVGHERSVLGENDIQLIQARSCSPVPLFGTVGL